MTLDEIQKEVEDIRESSGDDKSAHSQEDNLYFQFIVYIKNLNIKENDLSKKAEEVLKTQEIEFARWCA